jgi:maltooligosyltrehalose trehalohydrolase
MQFKKRKIGVNFINNLAEVLVWAPKANEVKLVVKNQYLPLDKGEYGYFSITTNQLLPGDGYSFELDIEGKLLKRADPASLFQPKGVHENAVAFDLSDFKFTDENWKGLALNQLLIYELHVGTFSQTSDFNGVANHLDHLIELGITAIELMPVAAFPGERNWGYDGVFPFAVQASYGGPAELQSFVNVCHQKGLAVILDVVYNHFGPEGSCFEDFAPYHTDSYQTPWGKAINFDGPQSDGVRHYFIENALMWLCDFHIDALRLDAVHAIKDFSAKHFLQQLREQVDQLNKASTFKRHLIIESDLNDPKYLKPSKMAGFGMDSQWIDEFHHALRVAVGEKPNGYYSDFNGLAHLAKSYTDAYVYDGQYSPHRQRIFGAKADDLAGENFIVFSQNHDQVGNRMLGERSSHLYTTEVQKLLFAATIVSPFIPMLFMGEEWGAKTPFLYFISHSDAELVEAVRAGRTKEFSAFHHGSPPDPQAETTFENSKLNWEELGKTEHQHILSFYKKLIALRKLNPVLNELNRKNIRVEVDSEKQCLFLTRWNNNQNLFCCLNFSDQVQQIALPDKNYQLLIDSASAEFGCPGSSIDSINHNLVQINPSSILIFIQQHV